MEYEADNRSWRSMLSCRPCSKIFCGCSTAFGAEPNTNCCPGCLGLPGTLPVLNRRAVEYAVMAALALNCRVQEKSVFARKNYFYPDLPKAYQISQDDATAGLGRVPGNRFSRRKPPESTWSGFTSKRRPASSFMQVTPSSDAAYSLVDYNRAGVPLLEIVTAPELRSGREARLFSRRSCARCCSIPASPM
jgi:aspartyl-tRNA(Asn)/glutamyl-tRNA(Gln) amidotransferase subunit B